MANVSRTIDIIFNGVDLVSKSTGKITTSIDKLIGKVEAIADPIANAVDKLLKMELAILAVSAAVGTIALASFKSYESALIDLEKVLGEGEVLAGDNQQAIEDLAIQYGKSATDIVKSTTDFKRAGFSLEDSITLLNRALELSSAGMVDLGDATNDIIGIMKGFELSVEEVTQVVDTVNKVSDTFATNATELSLALRRVAPAAKLAGLSIAEVTGYVVPAIEVFRSGEEASTAWRRGLTKILDDAAPTIAALERLGVAQREGPNKELRSGKDILLDFGEALKGATASNQLFAISQIFGNRQAVKMITAFRDMDYVLGVETVASGADHNYTMEQVRKRWESFETQLGASKSAIQLVAAELGGNLKPAVAKVLVAVTELFSSFRDNLREGAFDTLFTLLEDFGERIAEYLTKVGMELPKALQSVDYSALIKAFEGLFDKLKEIVDRFKLDTPEGLQAFLQETSDTMAGVVEATTGLMAAFDKFGLKVLEVIRAFTGLNAEQQKAAGEFAGWAKLIDEFGIKTLATLTLVSDNMNEVSNALFLIAAGIKHVAGIAEISLTALAEPMILLSKLLLIQSQILNFEFKEAWTTTKEHAGDVKDHMIRGFVNMTEGLEGLGKDYDDLVKKMRQSSKETAKYTDDIESVFNDLAATTKKDIDIIGELFTSDLVNAVRDVASKIPKEIKVGVTVEDDGIDDDIAAVAEELLKANQKFTENAKFKAEVELDREAKDLIDFISGTGKYAGTEIGVFTDENVKFLETRLANMRKDLSLTSDAVEAVTDVELDVPDDTKFQAAQTKLLKEIDTNAGIMETKLKTFADLAESESDTISASFDSISDSMTSTGDVLTELYRQMSGAGADIFAQQSIQRKISEEETRREEAFDLQKQLTTAQIDLIKQRAAAMAAGDPIVTVSGDGLQPHLEAFMWELLSAIQVRVNEDYGNFLLGIGAA